MEENADAEKVKRGVEEFQFKDSEHHAVFYVERQLTIWGEGNVDRYVA